MIPPVDDLSLVNPTPNNPTPEPLREVEKPAFEPPANWGNTPLSTPTPTIQTIPTTPPVEPKTSFLKIFLVGLSLILLGVLVGVVAAKLVPASPVATQDYPPANNLPTTQISEVPTPTMVPEEIIPAPTATPSSLLNLKWKTYSAKNYKLYYPQGWLLKYTADKLTLTKNKNILSISTGDDVTGFNCDGSSVLKLSKGKLVWDIQMSNASASGFYGVCEAMNPITSIGSITLGGDKLDQNIVDEFKLMMEKIEIMESTSSAAMMKEEQV